MKLFLILGMLFTFASCYNSNTELVVIEDTESQPLVLIDTFGKEITIPKGKIEAQIVLNKTKATFIIGKDDNAEKFPFKIKDKESFLYTNEPLTLTSEQTGQPVTLVVVRDVEKEFDRINVSIMNTEGTQLLATAQVINNNGSDKNSYDSKKNEFLSSYQKIKMSQRSLVFEIDAAVDDTNIFFDNLHMAGLYNAADNIVNYGAAVYISPWAYSRYYKINWILSDGSDSSKEQKNAWQTAMKESPIVDYVTWVHSGSQEVSSDWLKGKKENQLRMVYVGACHSGSSSEFISEYNAAVTSGHRNVSASPLFQFSFFRNWVYGRSFKNSIKKAWWWGNAKAKALEFITFAKIWQKNTGLGYWRDVDQMLYDSEMKIAYTASLPASDVSVDLSTVRSRSESAANTYIIVEEASKLGDDDKN